MPSTRSRLVAVPTVTGCSLATEPPQPFAVIPVGSRRLTACRILYFVINNATTFCDALGFDSMMAQATAQAYWSREYRKRRRQGLRVYELELPEIEIAEGLKRAGFLAADADAHDEICDALRRAVLLLFEDQTP
jgi:hypothetical protein